MDNNNQNQNNQTVLPNSDASTPPPPPAAETPNAGWDPISTTANTSPPPMYNSQSDNPLDNNVQQSTVNEFNAGDTTQLPQFGSENENTTTPNPQTPAQDTDPRPDWQKIDVSPSEVASPFNNNEAQSMQQTDSSSISSNAQPAQVTNEASSMPATSPASSDTTSYPGQIIDPAPTQTSETPAFDFRKPMVEPVMDVPKYSAPAEPATSAEPSMDTSFSQESLNTGTGLTPQNTDNSTETDSMIPSFPENTNSQSPASDPGMINETQQSDLSNAVDSSMPTAALGGISEEVSPAMGSTDNEMQVNSIPNQSQAVETPSYADTQTSYSESTPMSPANEAVPGDSPQSAGTIEADSSQTINFAQGAESPLTSLDTPVPAENTTMPNDAVAMQSPVDPPKSSGKKVGYVIAAIGLILILAVGGIFAFTQLSSDSDTSPAPQPALSTLPTSAPAAAVPTTAPDPMADWQTYTNSDYGFSFKYPSEYELIETHFTDGSYNIFISTETLAETPSDEGNYAPIQITIKKTVDSLEDAEALFNDNFVNTEKILSGSSAELLLTGSGAEGTTFEGSSVLSAYFLNDFLVNFTLINTIINDATFEKILSTFKFTTTSTQSPTPATDSGTLTN